MEAFRGRAYLAAIHEVVPELRAPSPARFACERLPELRAVVSIDERRHDGVYAWTDFVRRAGDVQEKALTGAQAAVSASISATFSTRSGSTARRRASCSPMAA